jgi:dihydrofolate reductase
MRADFTASVFVGTSLDGFIARENGDIEWLTSLGLDMGTTGYDEFFASVDALVVGRTTYELVQGFDPWPYAGKRVLVMSRTLTEVHTANTSVHSSLEDVIATLNAEGAQRIYADGGQVIQAFLRAGLVTEITISRAPVILGTGIPLFGPVDADVHVTPKRVRELGAGFVQTVYEVLRS